MVKSERSTLLTNLGISKNLLLLLEKLIEYLGEKYIGKYGHIYMYSDAIDVTFFSIYLKWEIVRCIKLL